MRHPAPPYNRLRHFSYNDGKNMQVTKTALPTGRWYPGTATLPDGKIIMVAGVAKSGCSNYVVGAKCKTASNPTYAVYDPKTRCVPWCRRFLYGLPWAWEAANRSGKALLPPHPTCPLPSPLSLPPAASWAPTTTTCSISCRRPSPCPPTPTSW